MSKIRSLVYLVVIGMLLVSGCMIQVLATPLPGKSGMAATATPPRPATATPAEPPATATASKPPTATPEPLPKIDPAVQAAMNLCEKVLPGQVCLAEGPVKVTAQPGRNLRPFEKPGQTLNLADIQTLKLGEAGSTKGLLVMRIQTEWPGGAFTAVAFGDVELVNEVPFDTREFNPMQSLKLATAPNQEGQAPTSGFFVASPEDGNLSTLVVNGAELSFGSGALLTSLAGGLTIQTLWGMVGVWNFDRYLKVIMGSRFDLTAEEILHKVVKREPKPDPSIDTVREVPAQYLNEWQAQKRSDAIKVAILNDVFKKYWAAEEARKKQKPWKGGWWKMTYGPTTVSGKCKTPPVADGDSGGDGKPYTTEIPICRGNNGNTILMYESGTSYDRVGPNLYAHSLVTEFDLLGHGNKTTEGSFVNLEILSATRMVLSNTSAEAGGCTMTNAVYLDFVRDDPKIRCGHIIYISAYAPAPKAPTPKPIPQPVDQPVEGQYQVRLGTLSTICDPAAKPFAPSFKTAGLSLSPENKLVVDAASTKYELELSNQAYSYPSADGGGSQDHLGIFTLQQPVTNSFGLMLSLVQMPGQQWAGNWLVTNEDATQLCGGSIDLLPPH